MTVNKYEIKNIDLQELMGKIPHSFLVWGNMLVLAFLIVSVFVLNSFAIYDKKDMVGRVVRVERRKYSTDSLAIVFGTADAGMAALNQKLFLQINKDKSGIKLNGRIIKITRRNGYESEIHTIVGSTQYDLHVGMTCNIEVVLQKNGFIANLAKSAFNK